MTQYMMPAPFRLVRATVDDNRTKLAPGLKGNQFHFTSAGVWKLYFSAEIQKILWAITVMGMFGVFFNTNNGEESIRALIIATSPLTIGFIFSTVIFASSKVLELFADLTGRTDRLFKFPLICSTFPTTVIFLCSFVAILPGYFESSSLYWPRLLVVFAFFQFVFEVVLRFIMLVTVPRVFSRMSDDDFLMCTGMIRQQVDLQSNYTAPPIKPIMANMHGLAALPQNVLMLEAQGNYVKVVTTERDVLVRSSLTSILDENPTLQGIKVHRSRWIADHACKMIEKRGADLVVQLINGDFVKVVRARHDAVAAHFVDQAVGPESPTPT